MLFFFKKICSVARLFFETGSADHTESLTFDFDFYCWRHRFLTLKEI